MQAFLPYPSFTESAAVLDDKRLGKQRVEALQILKAIDDPDYGWQNHPAVNMWRGYREAIACYGLTVCIQWRGRGFNDTVYDKIRLQFGAGRTVNSQDTLRRSGKLPSWIGDDEFHRSHQSRLLQKDSDWYGQFFKDVPDDLDYVWPR